MRIAVPAALALLGILPLGVSGCRRTPAALAQGAGPARDRAPERPIEMFSWWERVGDTDALGALFKEQRRHHPGDVIINASAGLSGLARKTLRNRMLRNEPPDTFQANAGHDLLQWVLMNGADARESRLLPLDDIVDGAAALRRALPAAVLEQVTYDGKMYGVPANVHRLNTIFYSRKVFAKYGLKEPTSVDDLFALGKKLRGTGVSLLAVGSREPWTVALLVFECLLVSREGPDTYRQYFRGELSGDDPRIVRTLQASLALLALANPDHDKLSWLQAVDLVARGQAAMTVMGDWARVSFKADDLKAGADYVEIPFPGTADTFVFTADAFSLPVDAKNRPGAQRLLSTIGSIDGQRVINGAKGSLPARLDVTLAEGDPVQAAKYALLQKGHLVLALSGLVPRVFSEDLAASLGEMLAEHDIEPVVHTLRTRYALLK